jgi:hypothetical protein
MNSLKSTFVFDSVIIFTVPLAMAWLMPNPDIETFAGFEEGFQTGEHTRPAQEIIGPPGFAFPSPASSAFINV